MTTTEDTRRNEAVVDLLERRRRGELPSSPPGWWRDTRDGQLYAIVDVALDWFTYEDGPQVVARRLSDGTRWIFPLSVFKARFEHRPTLEAADFEPAGAAHAACDEGGTVE